MYILIRMKEDGLHNMTLTRHTEIKQCKGKYQKTNLTNKSNYMADISKTRNIVIRVIKKSMFCRVMADESLKGNCP